MYEGAWKNVCIRASCSRALLELRAQLGLQYAKCETSRRCGCQWDCCKALAAGSGEWQEDVEGAVCCVSELVARSWEVVDGFVGQRVTIMRRRGTP